MTNPLSKIPLDKWQHFAIGASIATIVFIWTSLWLSILVVSLVAVAKKGLDYLFDVKMGKQPDKVEMAWDVAATVLGGAVVWAAILGCHLHN